jgi:Tol biopolymer transport system component
MTTHQRAPLALSAIVFLLFCSVLSGCPINMSSDQGRWGRFAGGGRFIGCRPSLSPDASLIVYASPATGHGDIYVVSLKDRVKRRLTNAQAYEGDPAWSYDGKSIVFAREEDDGSAHLWRMDADGGNQRQLTVGPWYDHEPSYSHDSEWIVFLRRPIQSGSVAAQIYRIGTKAGSAPQLVSNRKNVCDPSFSPSGDVILFSVGSREIWQMDARGDDPHLLGAGASPCFSPDGRSIAFISDRKEPYQYDVYVMGRDGKDSQRLTSTGGYKSCATFAPDGKRILFLAEPRARGIGNITSLDVRDKTWRVVARVSGEEGGE